MGVNFVRHKILDMGRNVPEGCSDTAHNGGVSVTQQIAGLCFVAVVVVMHGTLAAVVVLWCVLMTATATDTCQLSSMMLLLSYSLLHDVPRHAGEKSGGCVSILASHI